MHGHHHYRVLVGVVAVQVGVQGDLVQKARQGGLPLGVLHVAVDGSEQLAHVFQPGAALNVVFQLEGGGIARPSHHLLIEAGQVHGAGQGGELLQHGGKLGQLGGGLLQLRVGGGVGRHLPQGQPLTQSNVPGPVHRGLADAPGGIVDDAGEAQVVGVVVDGAQVGQHVLDLQAVKELHAAVDLVGDAVALEGHLQGVGLGVGAVEDRASSFSFMAV